MLDCCNNKTKKKNLCKRKDGKIFKLPRKFTFEDCTNKTLFGFTMNSSCAPYKYCKTFTPLDI